MHVTKLQDGVIMPHIRLQPAGPKAFRLYSLVRDIYRTTLGERAFTVYEALTYYVDSKTLVGAIPLKLLAQTTHYPVSTVRGALKRLSQEGLIAITPQWDAFECVPQANLYRLHLLPCQSPLSQEMPAPRRVTSRM